MVELRMKGIDFGRLVRACAKAASPNDIREPLRYIELRADGETCVATAMDGFVLVQLRVPCRGRGVIIIPATVKPEKSAEAVISAGDKLRVSFYDAKNKLIIAYEYQKPEEPFVKWREIIRNPNPEAFEVIHFNARYLRKIAMATAHADDQIFSIAVPKDKLENILIASGDEQILFMPTRVPKRFDRAFTNWYKDIR